MLPMCGAQRLLALLLDTDVIQSGVALRKCVSIQYLEECIRTMEVLLAIRLFLQSLPVSLILHLHPF
jgi:hypothetical protein